MSLPSTNVVPAPASSWLPGSDRAHMRVLAGLVVFEFFALLGLIAFVILAARDDGEFVARRTLLGEADLPTGWVPVAANAYPFMEDSPIIGLLQEEETVAGAFSAYRDPTDSSAVATYVVFRPDEPLVLMEEPGKVDLGRFALLVTDMERLSRQRLQGALPEVAFAVAEVPVPDALRGRSLAPVTRDGVQSDFIIFTSGPALAVVVVEHPRGQEPFRRVEELARTVYSRLLEELT